jgi:metal-responsive CopG/Arc/MetJ family transcriptional regulator
MVRRLNITMPESTAKKIDKIPNKSRFITEAVEERLNEIENEKLNRILAEGYKAMNEEDKAVNKEWEKITFEGWKK